jgi:hypothetical protein
MRVLGLGFLSVAAAFRTAMPMVRRSTMSMKVGDKMPSVSVDFGAKFRSQLEDFN